MDLVQKLQMIAKIGGIGVNKNNKNIRLVDLYCFYDAINE